MFAQFLFLLLWNFDPSSAIVNCDNDNYGLCYVRNQQVSDIEVFQISRTSGVPITDLIISSSEMPIIPSTIFTSYPNISFLSLSSNGLTKLAIKNFANAGKLQRLFIQNGLLTRITNATFRSCISLENLQVSSQNVKTIELNAFLGLNNLNTLSFTNNSLEVLHPLLFSKLPNLSVLMMDLNKIKKLSSNLFRSNPILMTVSFVNNRLTQLPSDLFSANPLIESIYLSFNLLKNAQTFGSKIYDASSNNLKQLQIVAGTESLHADDNFLEVIDCADVNLTSIKRLYLSNNSLANLDCIRDMSNLTDLDVTRNKFLRPTKVDFVNLTNIRFLAMFNQTKFQKIAAATFSAMKSIGNLRIDRFVDYRNLRQLFPSIYLISLTTRTWNCSYTKQVANALSRQKIRMNYNNYYDRLLCNITQP